MRQLRGSKVFWVLYNVFNQNKAVKGYWWISKVFWVFLLNDFEDFGEMKGFLVQVRNKRGKRGKT